MTHIYVQFYMKTGNCKFGATCKFHHPKDIKVTHTTQENVDSAQGDSDDVFQGDGNFVKPHTSISSAIVQNSKGLPIRPVSSIHADVVMDSCTWSQLNLLLLLF